MKKSALLTCVLILVVFGVWALFFPPLYIFQSYFPSFAKEFTLTQGSVEKIVLKYNTGTLISTEMPEITVKHSANGTLLTATANRTLIMSNVTTMNVKKITYDAYNRSLSEEEFNEIIDRLNYIFLHAKRHSGPTAISTGIWSITIYLNNSEKITLAKNVELWINGKTYTYEVPEEKDPVRYLTELGYEAIKI